MTGATKKVYVTSFHVAYIRGDSRYTSYFKKMSTDLKKIEKKKLICISFTMMNAKRTSHFIHTTDTRADRLFSSFLSYTIDIVPT